jgi:hypothetical protein
MHTPGSKESAGEKEETTPSRKEQSIEPLVQVYPREDICDLFVVQFVSARNAHEVLHSLKPSTATKTASKKEATV